MKKTIFLLLALFLLLPGVHAEEQKPASSSLWEKIRTRIEKITPDKKPAATTAVGGVRGAKQTAEELYWKGEESQGAVGEDELKAFKEALVQAEQGQNDQAVMSFKKFITEYQDSQLRQDAENAIKALQLELKQSK